MNIANIVLFSLLASFIAVSLRRVIVDSRPRSPQGFVIWKFLVWLVGLMCIPAAVMVAVFLHLFVRNEAYREHVLDFIFPAPWKDRHGS